jgi:thiol-disulfide isomerase/thioredoxin/sugar lactone lactonase YvrE
MSEAPTPAAIDMPRADIGPRHSSRRSRWLPPALLLAAAAVAAFLVFAIAYHGATPPAVAAPPKTAAAAPGDDDPPPRPRHRPPAPELDGGVAWFNTAGPLKLKDLRGKIVVLDFWTLCCINCIHTLPELANLEKKYANEIVVIGVHSPKFDEEKDSEAIRKAVLRYEVSHPVVNDANQAIWNAYDASSWPTLVLIDPEGNLVAKGSGEGLRDALDVNIAKLIKEFKEKKLLDEKPRKFELARISETGASPLFFPGKVLADEASQRLFISDSTHHRIVITDLTGKKIAAAGDGQPGSDDGRFGAARFNDPQGLALDGDTLYVADRKNNLIRALDLKNKTVSTVAGTGEQGDDREREGPALKVGLNSPWDLVLHDGKLYIAMAGFHQLWTLDIAKGIVGPYAGVGVETRRDGPLDSACFAQPSGLTTDGTTLYVADSEVSSVRAVPLDPNGRVKTIVGAGLFDFGDVDGVGGEPPLPGETPDPAMEKLITAFATEHRLTADYVRSHRARLQHALGVAFHDGKLYVADTYNSKIKVIDPEKRSSTTFVGGDPDGWLATPVFSEPGGISYCDGKLFVADTNAHRIRVVDLKTRAVSTLMLQGVEAPKPAS